METDASQNYSDGSSDSDSETDSVKKLIAAGEQARKDRVKIAEIQREVDEISDDLKNSLERSISNLESIEKLKSESEILIEEASQFKKTTHQVTRAEISRSRDILLMALGVGIGGIVWYMGNHGWIFAGVAISVGAVAGLGLSRLLCFTQEKMEVMQNISHEFERDMAPASASAPALERRAEFLPTFPRHRRAVSSPQITDTERHAKHSLRSGAGFA